MPKVLTLYGCQFDCGYQNTNLEDIKEHEASCVLNPEYKYCGACKERRESSFFADECKKYDQPVYLCGINHHDAGKCEACSNAQKETKE